MPSLDRLNQHGELQAIGGVNEKIEGFHRACKLRKLTGRQGVIIPESNVRHLMLSHEVVDSVRRGRFHVWSERTVDEGIELLTGIPAGERGADGSFPRERCMPASRSGSSAGRGSPRRRDRRTRTENLLRRCARRPASNR